MAFGAGAIVTKLTLDFANFSAGFTHVQALLGGFPSAIASLVAAPLAGLAGIAESAFASIKGAVSSVVESTHQVSVEAQRAGVSAGFLKQVGAAAKTVDTDIASVAHSMAFLGRNAAEAASGNQTAVQSFADLGISATTAAGKIKPTEQLFFEVADAIKRLPSSGQQAKAAMDLMSRGGIDMVPILKKGSEGIREIAAEMKAASGGAPKGLDEDSEKFHEAEIKIGAAMAGIKKAIAAPIIAAFAANADGIVESISTIAKVLRESFGGAVSAIAPAVGSIFKGLAGLAELVGSVVTPVFKVLQPVLEALGKALAFVFDLIGQILGAIGGVVRGVTDAIGVTDPAAASSSSVGGGGHGSGGSGGVNVERIDVAGIDPRAASSEIATRLQGPMRDGIARQKQQVEGGVRAELVRRSL